MEETRAENISGQLEEVRSRGKWMKEISFDKEHFCEKNLVVG